MIRNIIFIDKEKCNGCGLCINACHEGALQLVDGKATLISDSYCDGLGNCLPECPTGAIEIIQREAEDFNEEAVNKRMAEMQNNKKAEDKAPLPCGCPSTHAKMIQREAVSSTNITNEETAPRQPLRSELRQWPVQIKLVPPNAPYFKGSKLLIAADCTAYAHPNIHSFMKNKITLIGCPKLDDVDYSEKLTEILKYNDIESITVLRMEVPCCGGIVNAVKTALISSGKMIPWNVVTIGTDGEVLE